MFSTIFLIHCTCNIKLSQPPYVIHGVSPQQWIESDLTGLPQLHLSVIMRIYVFYIDYLFLGMKTFFLSM